jgi:hypothetical protein
MIANAPTARTHISAAFLAALMFVSSRTVSGQAPTGPRPDTLSTRARDSLIAAVLADTLDLDADTAVLLTPLPAFRQTLTLRPTFRSYAVGNVNAAEQTGYASWVARFRRATLRVDLTPVSYMGDTNTTATERPQVGFSGVSPISARLDVRVRQADTLRLFAQTMSFPGELTALDARALGAVGTSTVDLDAGAIGIAARAGVRYTRTQPLGSSGLALTVRGGAEYEPKPSTAEAISWRGTTVRGAIGVIRTGETGSVGTTIEFSRSYADSLGGRNLFPGGGSITFDARATKYIGTDGGGVVSIAGFYAKPVGIERPDQPTRIIPVGDFGGVSASAAIPAGHVTLLPVIGVQREASNAAAIVSGRRTTLTASGQTASVSFGVAVPIGRIVTLTPEVGGVFGSVGQTVSAQFPRQVRSQSFTDPIRGGWVSIEVSVSK